MSARAVQTQTDRGESFSKQNVQRKVHGQVHTNLRPQKEEQQAVCSSGFHGGKRPSFLEHTIKAISAQSTTISGHGLPEVGQQGPHQPSEKGNIPLLSTTGPRSSWAGSCEHQPLVEAAACRHPGKGRGAAAPHLPRHRAHVLARGGSNFSKGQSADGNAHREGL